MLRDISLPKFINLFNTIDTIKDNFDLVQVSCYKSIEFILIVKKQLYYLSFNFDYMTVTIKLLDSFYDREGLFPLGWQKPNRFSVLLLKKILNLIATNKVKCLKNGLLAY